MAIKVRYRIAERLEKRNMTWAELAKIVGKSAAHLKRLDAGTVDKVSGDLLARIAKALDVREVDELMFFEMDDFWDVVRGKTVRRAAVVARFFAASTPHQSIRSHGASRRGIRWIKPERFGLWDIHAFSHLAEFCYRIRPGSG